MFRILVVIMIVIPALEIFGLIMAGQWIGGWQTFLLVVLTGILGAFLTKKEGAKVMHTIRYQWSYGQIPAKPVMDAVLIFAGGLLLLTPGFFTDTLGFLMVLPYTRKFFAGWVFYLIQKYLRGKGWFR